MAFPQRRIRSAPGAVATFLRATLHRYDGKYEYVSEKVWQTTAIQNLVRYRPPGTYFARFRVGGKLVWKSLKTATFSVAKQRLPDTLREHRSKIESFAAFADGKMTVSDAADVYRHKVRASVSLKPRSKDYREMMIDFIRRSWRSLFDTDVRKVTQRDCEAWLSRYQQHYSPSVVNNSIGMLPAIFDEAIRTGARFNNPAAALSRMKIRQKRLELPSREEFLKFVDAIQNAGARRSKDCANLVCFLAYSGLRIGEARHVTWADVNFWNHRHVARFSVFLWRFPDLLGRVTGGNCLATTMSLR